jgi:hypothetical protein
MATPTPATRRRGRTADNRPEASAPEPIEAAPESAAHRTGDTAGRPRAAAEKTARRNSTRVTLPFIGTVSLPARDELAFLGGVGVLAAIGVIEWPVAAALGAGHALVASRRNRVVREFGEALESA